MAGEKAVHHQKTLLEILSGAKGARENRAFSAGESVQLYRDGAVDSVAEDRETLDAGEGFAALNPKQKATFSAGGAPVVVGEGSVVTKASAARVLVGGGLSIAAAFALAAAATWIMSQFGTPTLEVPIPAAICDALPGNSSILSFFSALVCH